MYDRLFMGRKELRCSGACSAFPRTGSTSVRLLDISRAFFWCRDTIYAVCMQCGRTVQLFVELNDNKCWSCDGVIEFDVIRSRLTVLKIKMDDFNIISLLILNNTYRVDRVSQSVSVIYPKGIGFSCNSRKTRGIYKNFRHFYSICKSVELQIHIVAGKKVGELNEDEMDSVYEENLIVAVEKLKKVKHAIRYQIDRYGYEYGYGYAIYSLIMHH
uniref:Uncharacterized protein n=1 Tax=Strigamia maritima TaxID=126957 RepID=T1J8Z0_STRMM